jgi:hypothetical protein
MNYADQAADDTRLAHEAIQRRRELACTALSLETALSYDVRVVEAATGPSAIVARAHLAETRARIAALETAVHELAEYAIEMADDAVLGYTLAALPAVASYYEEHHSEGRDVVRNAIRDHYEASTIEEWLAAVATAQAGVPDALVSELRRIITRAAA